MLLFESVRPSDQGEYWCEANSTEGWNRSISINVTGTEQLGIKGLVSKETMCFVCGQGKWNAKLIIKVKLSKSKLTAVASLEKLTFSAQSLCMNEWMNACMHACMHEWMNEWMDGWMNEWMNEWMNGTGKLVNTTRNCRFLSQYFYFLFLFSCKETCIFNPSQIHLCLS